MVSVHGMGVVRLCLPPPELGWYMCEVPAVRIHSECVAGTRGLLVNKGVSSTHAYGRQITIVIMMSALRLVMASISMGLHV